MDSLRGALKSGGSKKAMDVCAGQDGPVSNICKAGLSKVGKGPEQIEKAIEKKIDCFVTSDLKYHDYFKANNQILLVDIGHYESEKFTKELIFNYLKKKIPKFACIITKTKTNPVNYF